MHADVKKLYNIPEQIRTYHAVYQSRTHIQFSNYLQCMNIIDATICIEADFLSVYQIHIY